MLVYNFLEIFEIIIIQEPCCKHSAKTESKCNALAMSMYDPIIYKYIMLPTGYLQFFAA